FVVSDNDDVEFCENAVFYYPRYAFQPLLGLFRVLELHVAVDYEAPVVAYYGPQLGFGHPYPGVVPMQLLHDDGGREGEHLQVHFALKHAFLDLALIHYDYELLSVVVYYLLPCERPSAAFQKGLLRNLVGSIHGQVDVLDGIRLRHEDPVLDG